jgi:hypothetical protein
MKKSLMEQLAEAHLLLQQDPSLENSAETEPLARRLNTAARRFVKTAKRAHYHRQPEFIELYHNLKNLHPDMHQLARIYEILGMERSLPERGRYEAIAIYALETGKTGKVMDELRKTPEQIIKEAFTNLALLTDEDEIRERLKKLMKRHTVERVAKAIGFEPTTRHSAKKEEEVIDRKQAVENALEKLKPYRDSLRVPRANKA